MATQLLTYVELADIWGVSKEAARKKVEGLHLKRQPGNDGRTRVMIDLVEVQHEPAKCRTSARRPDGSPPGSTTETASDLRRLISILEAETARIAALEAERRADFERERDRGDKLAADLAEVRGRLAAVEVERDSERSRAGQVDVLTAVLEVERQRLAEARQDAEQWRAAATAPQPPTGLGVLWRRITGS